MVIYDDWNQTEETTTRIKFTGNRLNRTNNSSHQRHIKKGLRMGYLISTSTDRNEHFIGGLKQQITTDSVGLPGLQHDQHAATDTHPAMLKQIALFELPSGYVKIAMENHHL